MTNHTTNHAASHNIARAISRTITKKTDAKATTVASLTALAVVVCALCACSGPQPLSLAIDPKDDDAYKSMLASGAASPRDAFLAERARNSGITTEEAARRDLALSETSNPFNAHRDQSAVSRGAVIFSHECASCHGENADGNGPALPIPMPSMNFHRTGLRWDITMRGGAVSKWFKTIQGGATAHATRPDGSPVIVQMPAFDQRLSREQTWLVITYLQSLDHDLPEAEKVR